MGSLAYDTIADLLQGNVVAKKAPGAKPTRYSSKDTYSVVKKATEVMVKVSGNGKGAAHAGAHLDYISRNGKLELEDENGDLIKGKQEVKELLADWMSDRGKVKENTRDTTHIVLSMPKGTNADSVKEAARNFAKKQFSDNHQYVFALHTDADNPHVHLAVKNLGHDGRRLHVKKGDPQKWRTTFSKELNRVGVDASATHRSVRGVIKKPVKQAIHHIREKGQPSKTDIAKIKEAVDEYRGKAKSQKPWEKKIIERQTHVRKSWLMASKELLKSKDTDDTKLGESILKFVNAMPPMKTERHQMLETVSRQNQTENQNERNQHTTPER